MIPDLNVNKQRKQYNTRATYFTEIAYLKQRQKDMRSLVFKKLNLCPVIQASRGVNPLRTSQIAEHLSSICLHSWSHDKSILYLISHCLNKKSRIRETKHLSTDADSSTDAIGGWTKAKSAKKTFFCAAILDHFETKMFKC